MVDLNGAHLRLIHEDKLLEMRVFCTRAGDGRDMIVNGKIVMSDRQIKRTNKREILQEAEEGEVVLYARRRTTLEDTR